MGRKRNSRLALAGSQSDAPWDQQNTGRLEAGPVRVADHYLVGKGRSRVGFKCPEP